MAKSKFMAAQPKRNRQFTEMQKSKGILDDYAERGNVDTKEGSIQHTPTAAKHIVNKEYVDAGDGKVKIDAAATLMYIGATNADGVLRTTAPITYSDGGNWIGLGIDQSAITHDNLISGTIASHDTSATGAELDTLTDNSIADALHRHSELVASDGTPDPALSVNAAGQVGIGTTAPAEKLQVAGVAKIDSIQVTGSTAPSTGLGTEIIYTGSAGRIQAFNRTGGVALPMEVSGLTTSLQIGGVTKLHVQADGNVGIGTTAPTSKFVVRDDADSQTQPLGTFIQNPITTESDSDTLIVRGQTSAVALDVHQFGTGNIATFSNDNDLKVTIDNAGNVGIGIITPTAKTHIDQSSTTAAIPVLTLDQADISEEMIEFVTTIGVGNAIEAVAAKALTTTHFIKVTIPGGLTRYIPCGTIA